MMKVNKLKIKDSILVGIIGGLIGVTCMDISNIILYRNRRTEALYGYLAGSMIMKPAKLKKGKNFLIGQLFHMTVGSVLGVGMIEILKRFGKDHHIIKGVFLSVTTWGFLYNFGQKMGFYRMNPRLTQSGYAAIWHHLIYGLATSQAIVTLADPSVFSQKEFGNETSNSANRELSSNIRTVYSDMNINSAEATSDLN
ncbi:hypothetical protein DSBG_4310 [Desulfosporosinus sp. BG]|nr:hypothetical protein DSBG_4310 [Desulfosporosinus sp. BG]